MEMVVLFSAEVTDLYNHYYQLLKYNKNITLNVPITWLSMQTI